MALPVRSRKDDAPAASTSDVGGWDPVGDLDRLHHDLARHLDSWRHLPSLLGQAFTPLADVEETADAYVVEIELAGVNKEDVDVELTGRRLTVTGERKQKQRTGILRRRERVVGRFRYEVVLHGDVDEDGVEAHLEEGVLSVRIPKPVADRPRRITIR